MREAGGGELYSLCKQLRAMNVLQCALVVVVAVVACVVTLAVFEYGRFTALRAQDGGSGSGCVEGRHTVVLLYAGLIMGWASAVVALRHSPRPAPYKQCAPAAHSTAEATTGVV